MKRNKSSVLEGVICFLNWITSECVEWHHIENYYKIDNEIFFVSCKGDCEKKIFFISRVLL